MKTYYCKQSLIALGITTALGVSTQAMAASSGTTTTSVDIKNVATASYNVAGIAQTPITSNEVVVRVSEQVSFTLVSNNSDGSPGDDTNVNEEVAPNGFAVFQHTLTNTGNRSDSYTLRLEDVTGDDGNYDLANSTVSYSIFNPGNDTPIATQSGIPVTTANGQSITLEKGQFIKFTVSAKTNGNKGGDRLNLRLSATSTVLPEATRTVTNSNDAVTKLPVFSIVKTFTNALDLNDVNDTAAYRIVIKNPRVSNATGTEYSTSATDITIADELPAGLVIASAVNAGNITVTGNATKGTVSSSSNGFTIAGANLPIDATITIEFTVKKAPNASPAAGALNHVKITDDLDNNANTANTLVDSTKSADEVNMANFYPADDTDFTDGTIATGNNGNDSTQPLLTINRRLTLTNPTVREVAPKGEVAHQTLITNNGQDTEGNTANALTFTINDNDNGTPDLINIVPDSVTLTYDPDGPGPASAQAPVNIRPNSSGIYDVNSALPGGIAPGGTVNISYKVASDNAELGSTEDTIVTLRPRNEGAPVVAPITDTTNVRGLTLVKSQGLDANCDNQVDTSLSSSSTPLAALPDQCVIYQIAATNTSSVASGFDINDLVISDALANFATTADYRVGTAAATISNGSTISSPATKNDTSVTTTISPLKPQGVATMRFAVKIKNNRSTN